MEAIREHDTGDEGGALGVAEGEYKASRSATTKEHGDQIRAWRASRRI
jgi:hypothetical protein